MLEKQTVSDELSSQTLARKDIGSQRRGLALDQNCTAS